MIAGGAESPALLEHLQARHVGGKQAILLRPCARLRQVRLLAFRPLDQRQRERDARVVGAERGALQDQRAAILMAKGE